MPSSTARRWCARRIVAGRAQRPQAFPGDRPARHAGACTKWSARAYAERIPAGRSRHSRGDERSPARSIATCGRLLFAAVDEAGLPGRSRDPAGRRAAAARRIERSSDLLRGREPVMSRMACCGRRRGELQAFVEAAGIPFYTTRRAAGESRRSRAVLPTRGHGVYAGRPIRLGTRMNYIIGHDSRRASTQRPRSAASTSTRGDRHQPAGLDVGVRSDAKVGARALTLARAGRVSADRFRRLARPAAGQNRPAGRAGRSCTTRRRSIRSALPRAGAISWRATRSSASTGRRSEHTAARRSRPSSPGTG